MEEYAIKFTEDELGAITSALNTAMANCCYDNEERWEEYNKVFEKICRIVERRGTYEYARGVYC